MENIENKVVEIQNESNLNIQKANQFEIKTNQDYLNAGEFLKGLKSLQKKISDFMKPIVKSAYDNWKTAKDKENSLLQPVTQAESIIKSKIISFQQEQERKRREEEERLRELQRKEAEKLAKKAEKEMAKGNEEKAEELQQQAEMTKTITPIVESTVQKVNGISTKKIWKFRIVDVNLIPREYMIPNEKMLGEVARATKGTLKVEGVEFYSEDNISAGR